ncbi:EAL domain-containing protein [Shewanella avicenniae]|uniref:EAL domain-containing protein n=1 Tax=Shewanella avicenniae TaxID=2814294 RepID=A0ABX7QS17_9GAMM|nr:EAL domain-containing protein [Shewanella avicenniae]QSX34259.1 EAL domain-containing protein [Shewanella avicenniae]
MTATKTACQLCRETKELAFEISMAFQPIVDANTLQVFGYEALVRGQNGEGAGQVLAQVDQDNLYRFDQTCRVTAIEWASKLGLDSMLSINFMPNAVYQAERCIATTLKAAERFNFPATNIMFEFTEGERISDSNHVKEIISCYNELGFRTAIDDFGAGYSGLNLLAEFQTDIIKLDMALISNIDRDKARQSIVRHCIAMLHELNITVLAEGIETAAEAKWLQAAGVDLMQGYLFAKPGFQSLPIPDVSALTSLE